MKKILLASALLISLGVSAQFSYGYHGLHNVNSNLRQGWGFGMDGLSSPLVKDFPVKFQAGFGYNVLWGGTSTFNDVLIADGVSRRDVVFQNLQFSLNGIFRVSVPSPNGRFTPYAEIAPGFGMNTSTLDFHDEDDNCDIYTVNRSGGFNLTAGTGVLIKINELVSVDAGMIWDKNNNRGNVIMLNTIDVNDGVTYDMKAAPSTVVSFRLGLRITLPTEDCCSYSGCTIKRHHKTCGHTELPHR